MNYPKKDAPVEHSVIDVIEKRWSPLAFSDQPIEEGKIQSLFEAMRWAPSSYNEQPWRVVYATKDQPEEYENVASLLVEGNDWAKNAYLLMVICATPNFSKNNNPNLNASYDTGAAIENLFLQAVSMDLVGHEMAGFDHDAAHEKLDIPKEVEVLAMMAVGYPGDAAELSGEMLERENSERVRKPLSEVAFKNTWQ